MTKIILFNKPYGVISQFSASPPHLSLKDFIPVIDVYPAGRLDTNSEGLMILTNDGKLQAQICEPRFNKTKTYWLQIEGIVSEEQLLQLETGVELNDFTTKVAQVKVIEEPDLWERIPPIRQRKNIPTSWLELIICEGKNHQVRRMSAKVGLPTLRLVRVAIGGIKLADLALGQWQEISYMQFQQQFK